MGKPRAIIFGAGISGMAVLSNIKESFEVIAFIDNDERKWGTTAHGNIPIHPPSIVEDATFDMIFVGSYAGLGPMSEQLVRMGVPPAKIDSQFALVTIKSRIRFLENLKTMFDEKGIDGSVAEGGVFQGEFAKEINRVFPDRSLYLFDTFTGFDSRDVEIEKRENFSSTQAGHFNITNVELVLAKMPNREMCIVKEGFFPETTKGVDDTFCFVNLDFDLYQPILAGLEFFVPKMVRGGVVLVDDYFAGGYKGARQAVVDFTKINLDVKVFPIGDGNSVAVLCP